MIRALFISSKARARGPTAAQIAAQMPGVRADCGGVGDGADDELSPEQLEWADRIFIMETRDKTRLAARFGHALRGKTLINLDIQDHYSFMQPELVEILTDKLSEHLKSAGLKGG